MSQSYFDNPKIVSKKYLCTFADRLIAVSDNNHSFKHDETSVLVKNSSL